MESTERSNTRPRVKPTGFEHALAVRDPASSNRVLSIAPTQQWHGREGPWSTFWMGAGTPMQYFEVLVFTAWTTPSFVVLQGCGKLDSPNCPADRGGLLLHNQSPSWQPRDNFSVPLEEHLGYPLRMEFGFETINFGAPGSGAVNVTSQLVGGIASSLFYNAGLGMRPIPTNLSSFNDPIPSWMSKLKAAGQIASLSWAYTAGSYSYDRQQSFGSLTVGGYDAARFEPSNTWFSMASADQLDLIVGLHAISIGSNSRNVLQKPALMALDSAVPDLWLPAATCLAFQEAFALTWNATLGNYLVNDTAHRQNLDHNTSVAFRLSNDIQSTDAGPTIELPYSAFDLQLFPAAGVAAPARYFPLRPAANASQYTLGRAFFQHAYVVADYERRTFSVNQARFPPSGTQDLRELSPPAATPTGPAAADAGRPPALPAGVIIGAVLGAVVFLVAVSALAWWQRRRRRWAKRASAPTPAEPPKELPGISSVTEVDSHDGATPRSEVGGGSWAGVAYRKVGELDGRPRCEIGSHGELYEMEGGVVAAKELKG